MAETVRERGLLIVVEGLDRSGKSTQCELLCKYIEKHGNKAKHYKFPDRTTPTGVMINSYLTNQAQLDDHVIHLLFSANRWEAASSVRNDINSGIWVVIDRYSYSGAVYSAAKRNPNLNLEWAWAPELGLPQPDVVFFLDISAADATVRGGYGEERYENKETQTRVRHLFQEVFASVHPMEDTATSVITVNAGSSVADVAASIARHVPKSPPRTVQGETCLLQNLSQLAVS